MRKFTLAICVWLMAGLVAMGQLTATVQPGYTFATGERPTTATLNMLGQPTISIAGTVSGTVGLAAGTVTGTHLANSVPDGVTIDFNSSSPRQLRIVPASGGAGGGVSVNQINANICGVGLYGGSGSVLWASNIYSRLMIVTNGFLLGGGTGNYGTNVTVGTGLTLTHSGAGVTLAVSGYSSLLSGSKFTSSEQTIVNTITVSHSLAGAPQSVRWVLRCKTADRNYSVGDEVSVESFVHASFAPCFNSWTSATQSGLIANAVTTMTVRDKSTGNYGAVDETKWKAVCYAVYYP